jgi:hypothetical protein
MGDGAGYECRSEGLLIGTKQSRRAGCVGCAGLYETTKIKPVCFGVTPLREIWVYESKLVS